MYFTNFCIGILILHFYFLDNTVTCNDGNFILKAARNVPRIGKRSKDSRDDSFEKFFLKASKSVPRIGRRGSPLTLDEMKQLRNDDCNCFEKFILRASKTVPRVGRRSPPLTVGTEDSQFGGNNNKYPIWAELSERFENDPELFTYPRRLLELEQALGDDPSAYDLDKVRLKRTNIPPNYDQDKETIEYRLQADSYM